jgi:hypothetical protein
MRSAPPPTDELFEEVVRLTGLAAFIGPSVVRRALAITSGVTIDQAMPEHYRQALPELRSRMSIYLKPEAAAERIREIETLLSRR